jgi:hypothetical protein
MQTRACISTRNAPEVATVDAEFAHGVDNDERRLAHEGVASHRSLVPCTDMSACACDDRTRTLIRCMRICASSVAGDMLVSDCAQADTSALSPARALGRGGADLGKLLSKVVVSCQQRGG